MSTAGNLHELLQEMAEGGGPVLETLTRMSATALQQAGLDERTGLVARFAALVALDASPPSYLIHLGVAGELGIEPDTIRAVLAELAPLVGSARTVSAATNIQRAIQLAQS